MGGRGVVSTSPDACTVHTARALDTLALFAAPGRRRPRRLHAGWYDEMRPHRTIHVVLPAEGLAVLRGLARAAGATYFTAIMALVQLWQARVTGKRDIVTNWAAAQQGVCVCVRVCVCVCVVGVGLGGPLCLGPGFNGPAAEAFAFFAFCPFSIHVF